MKRVAYLIILVAVGCSPSAHADPSSTSPASTVPPLVVVFMENHSASGIIGNPNAPWMNSFAAGGQRFTNYREGSTGSSLPDYLQIAAGSTCGKTSDAVVAGDGSIANAGCTTTVWNQLQNAGHTWAVYQEGMPSACYGGSTYMDIATNGGYALKHNPATPFPAIWNDQALCQAHVLPLTALNPASLPEVSFIAPNICNDMHGILATSTTYTDCAKNTQEIIARGDSWLRDHVQPLLDAGARVFVTFDESKLLYAAMGGPGTTPQVDAAAYTHYSLLAGIEDSFGLPRLGQAGHATPLPL